MPIPARGCSTAVRTHVLMYMLRTLTSLKPPCHLSHIVIPRPQDTKIRVVLDGPPAPPSPVPEVNEQDDSESTRTGTASAGGHHDAMHPASAHFGTGAPGGCVL